MNRLFKKKPGSWLRKGIAIAALVLFSKILFFVGHEYGLIIEKAKSHTLSIGFLMGFGLVAFVIALIIIFWCVWYIAYHQEKIDVILASDEVSE